MKLFLQSKRAEVVAVVFDGTEASAKECGLEYIDARKHWALRMPGCFVSVLPGTYVVTQRDQSRSVMTHDELFRHYESPQFHDVDHLYRDEPEEAKP